jgi:hypothetical protein
MVTFRQAVTTDRIMTKSRRGGFCIVSVEAGYTIFTPYIWDDEKLPGSIWSFKAVTDFKISFRQKD